MFRIILNYFNLFISIFVKSWFILPDLKNCVFTALKESLAFVNTLIKSYLPFLLIPMLVNDLLKSVNSFLPKVPNLNWLLNMHFVIAFYINYW